jgi:hypothetical protein
VLVHEIPEGNWGAGGAVVRLDELREAAARHGHQGAAREDAAV